MGHRILVLRLSSLGDVVLTAPVFRNLKAHWPDARVCLLVKPQFRAAVEGNPFVDEVLVYRGLRSALREIRRKNFTHLLDLHATWRTFWIRQLSRIREVSVYRKDALARRLFVLFRWNSPALVKHTLDRYLESLSVWGVPVRYRDLTLGDYSGGGRKPKATSRVLLVQTSFLGDTLLTLPLARRVKEVLPGCRLSVLTRPQTAAVFRRSPFVDEVVEDDKHGRHSGLRGLFSLARRLRRRRFDMTLVAHRSLRSALAVWLARIPYRVGFSSSAGWFFYHQTVFFPWGMPELERNLALLLPIKPDLRTGREDSLYLASRNGNGNGTAAFEERLSAWGVRPGDRLVGVHPGSAWRTKRWPPERYARLIARLVKEQGVRVLLIGGKDDRPLTRRISQEAGVEVLDLAGKTDLPDLIDLAKRLELMITNDSGPMHVAAATGVPTLALFGPTTRELGFFPHGSGHRVLETDLACRPCGLHGGRACPEGHFLCMRLITVGEVFSHAEQMLRQGRAVSA